MERVLAIAVHPVRIRHCIGLFADGDVAVQLDVVADEVGLNERVVAVGVRRQIAIHGARAIPPDQVSGRLGSPDVADKGERDTLDPAELVSPSKLHQLRSDGPYGEPVGAGRVHHDHGIRVGGLNVVQRGNHSLR